MRQSKTKCMKFEKPLSPNKCIRILMSFSAANEAITDKTLKVTKQLTRVPRDRLKETYHTKV